MEVDPIQLLATVAVLGVIVKGAVDAIRRKYPTLDGGWIQAIAAALGIGLAAGLDIQAAEVILEAMGGSAGREPHAILDFILTGLAIAFGAGAIAEATGRSANPPVAIVEVDTGGNHL